MANYGLQGEEVSKLLALVKEWKEVVLLLVGAVAAVLTTLGFDAKGPALLVGCATAALLLGAGAYFYYRLRRRHELVRRRELSREHFEINRQRRTAFRGLYPYREGDVLPGRQRQREAQTFFTQMTDSDFSFGVICGDSGCGKTSLLRSALQSRLKEDGEQAGYRVLYVSSPRELAATARTCDGGDDNLRSRLEAALENLTRMIEHTGGGLPVALILDQFEEFFIEYPKELRPRLGAFLYELTEGVPRTRILCAVRRDYLVDMLDLAPHLPEPISVRTLFKLSNLTAEQAADIIEECARHDGVILEGDFARTLAADLAEGGEVRPPELQIVCAALAGNPSLDEYRLAGGARGILSHYIRNAVELCGDPRVGGQVLRALCDFPAQAKSNPQTLTSLSASVSPPSGLGPAQVERLVGNILAQLESDRLAIADTRGPEPAYALVHDYLVPAVDAATSDLSTRTEEANQLLQYYLSESRSDKRVRVSLRRIHFIRKHADPATLATPRAARLLSASQKAHLLNAAALSITVLVLTVLLVALVNTRRTWEQRSIGRHDPGGNEADSVSIVELPVGGIIATAGVEKGVRLWETKTGKLLISEPGSAFKISPGGEFIFILAEDSDTVDTIHLPSRRRYEDFVRYSRSPLFISDGEVPYIHLNTSGTALAYLELPPPEPVNIEVSQHNKTNQDMLVQGDRSMIKVWSIPDRQELGRFTVTWRDFEIPVYLSKAADRVVTYSLRDGVRVPGLWDVQAGALIAYLAPSGSAEVDSFDVDEERGRVVTTRHLPDHRVGIQMWDLRTGSLISERSLQGAAVTDHNRGAAVFSNDGEYVRFQDRGSPKKLMLLEASDFLRPVKDLGDRVREVRSNSPVDTFVIWPNVEGGAYLWNCTRRNPPILIRDLTLTSVGTRHGVEDPYTLYIDPSITRLALFDVESRKVELYNIRDGNRLEPLEIAGRPKDVKLNLDGGTISILFEGGLMALYSLRDGEQVAELEGVGHDKTKIFYDADCRRAHVWTAEGRVLRYSEGWKVLGRWFWPSGRCGH